MEWGPELQAVSDEHREMFMEPLRCVRPIARFRNKSLTYLVRSNEVISASSCAFFTSMLAMINILVVLKVRAATNEVLKLPVKLVHLLNIDQAGTHRKSESTP